MSSPTTTTFREQHRDTLPGAIAISCPYEIVSGSGSLLTTACGRELIDFTSGIAVMNVGHAHPRVTDAVARAAAQGTHFCFQVMGYGSYPALAQRLVAHLPETDGDGRAVAWKAAFFNSGAEAVENAMKIARVATKRTTFLAFQHSFHGRTFGAMSLTSKPVPYRAGFAPLVPEVVHLPYPTRYRCTGCACGSDADCTRTTLARIEEIFATRVPPGEVAAVFVEPIVGEGGFYVPPDDFLPALREICTRHGILLVVDEIQTGIARTGTFYRYEASGIVPDMVLTAKALGGGLPLSGVLGRAEILDAVPPGGIGGTYGGNPVAVAAAHAVLDIVDDENLCEQARAKGAMVMETLRGWQREIPAIGDVRGAGLMIAMEFVKDRTTREPDKSIVPKIVAACYADNLAVLAAGTYSNCIRVLPALTITTDELREGLARLERAIRGAISA